MMGRSCRRPLVATLDHERVTCRREKVQLHPQRGSIPTGNSLSFEKDFLLSPVKLPARGCVANPFKLLSLLADRMQNRCRGI